MLQKNSTISVIDNSGIKWLRLFHLYQGFKRKTTGLKYFVKGSARVVQPPRLEYKGFKYKPIRKGFVTKALIVSTALPTLNYDGSVIRFKDNSALSIKKKKQPRSKHVSGPISRRFNRRTYQNIFTEFV